MEKIAKKPVLMNLPLETKELVNQGIFSLYALTTESAKDAHADYILYTGMHSFLLDGTGNVVKELSSKIKFDTARAINFPEINSSVPQLFKLNFA